MDKPLSLSEPPAGAKFTDLKTPEDTFQMIGKPKVKVPESISIDLGVVDVFITNRGKDIEFVGHGLKTDVGRRIPGPEKGMSLKEGRILANDKSEALYTKKERRQRKSKGNGDLLGKQIQDPRPETQIIRLV